MGGSQIVPFVLRATIRWKFQRYKKEEAIQNRLKGESICVVESYFPLHVE
jgi:hypothetical protein